MFDFAACIFDICRHFKNDKIWAVIPRAAKFTTDKFYLQMQLV